jgi:UTP--glucose-1-phosphate uridylyltransferase
LDSCTARGSRASTERIPETVKVTKVVIPAAGFGTRFLPVTKTVPKEMLPIVAKPVIQYIIEGAVASGITTVILVTSPHKKSLEDFFDTNFELEAWLEKQGKWSQLDEVRRATTLVDTVFVRQKAPLGNGHAVLAAKHVVGDEPFAVLWGDDILLGNPPVAKQLIDIAEEHQAPVVGVRRVEPEDFDKYGMLEVESVPGEDRLSRALSVIEKPRRQESPSNLAQIGGFVLTPDIFSILEDTRVGAGGEIWLTDALLELMKRRTVYAYEFEGIRYDAGKKLDYLKATVDFALQDQEVGTEFRSYLESLDTRSVQSQR